jgi:thiamine-phosphate diphosphorylase
LAQGGVSLIYLREPSLDDRALARLTRTAVESTAGTACRVVVRDRADLAVAADARGVHLSAAGLPATALRPLLGPGAVIGRSVHDGAAVRSAVAEGCDYLLLGTVYRSAGKPPGHPTLGEDGFASVAGRSSRPVLAIGGVTLAALPRLAARGAAGFGAIGLFAPPPGGSGRDIRLLEAQVAAVVAAARIAFAAAPGAGDPGRAGEG